MILNIILGTFIIKLKKDPFLVISSLLHKNLMIGNLRSIIIDVTSLCFDAMKRGTSMHIAQPQKDHRVEE